MTVHKLSAGDGYTYLTRHIATGDATESRKNDAVDYYVAKGTPPGIWCGRLAEHVGVSTGDEVTEEAMRSVFGSARTPGAMASRPGKGSSLQEVLDWSASTALGRAFAQPNAIPDFVTDVEERCATYKAQYGKYPDTDTRVRLQFEVAVRHLRRIKGEKVDLIDDATVTKFIADQYARRRQPVAGYDLVFTPVKSISVLWGLGDAAVKAAIEDAHKQAVDETLAWIEDEVLYTRRGAQGALKVKADGALIARFDHYDNRVGDPNLHTHCAVLNRVLADGRWTTIDGSVLYKANVACSERYNTRVADLVSRSLGVSFAPRPDTPVGKQPVYEIEGIPVSLLEEFSRRKAIEDRQAELARDYKARFGRNPPKKVQYAQAQQATLDTRNAKNPPRSLSELRAEWRARADALFPEADVDNIAGWARLDADTRPVFAPELLPELVERAADTLSRKVGTWTVFSISAELNRCLREFRFTGETDLEAAVADALELALRDHCLPVFTEVYDAPEAISERVERGLRRIADVDRAEMRYTAQSVLDAERYMRENAELRDDRTVPETVIDLWRRHVEEEEGYGLGDDQAAMVEHFLTAGRNVAVAVGAAGAGKTTAAKVIARAWESTHGKVIALGPSAKAADVLGSEIGVDGRTIADILTRVEVGLPTGIEAGDMLLVDEAGMASARNLADLTRVAMDAGAVVRLLGDPQQLASVEAGGVLRDLAERSRAPFLRKVHRFRTEGEAAASHDLRDGRPQAIEWYDEHDRIRAGMKHELPDLVFAAYVDDVEAGRDSLMVAPTNDLVSELNVKASAYYREQGRVTGPMVMLADGLDAGVGDVVVTRKNTASLKVVDESGARLGRVKNGDLWTVQQLGDDGSITLRNTISGGSVVVPADYVDEHLQLGYATTVHRSQGMTVENCHVLAGSMMTRQTLYVSMTRGKGSNVVYAAYDELPDWDFEHPAEEAPDVKTLLLQILARDASQVTAHQMIEEEQRKAASFERVRSTYNIAAGALYENLTAELLGKILTEQQYSWVAQLGGWDAIVTTVAQCETFGWDTRALLRSAVGVMLDRGRAGDLDTEKNAPGRVLGRALKASTAELQRFRSDTVAPYHVPAVSAGAAATDPILASYAQAYQEQMHAYIDDYIAAAVAADSPWITAIGDPGTDPGKVSMWERVVPEIAVSRVVDDAPNSATDPYAALTDDRRRAMEKLIRLIRSDRSTRSAYADYSIAELMRTRTATQRRLSETMQLLRLAERELDRARGTSAVGSVHSQLDALEADEQRIAVVRAARERRDGLYQAGTATAAELDRAQQEVLDAEAAAPPERQWPVIERSAHSHRAARVRHERAQVLDERTIGKLETRVSRLASSAQAERRLIEMVGWELDRRPTEPEVDPVKTRNVDPDFDPGFEPPPDPAYEYGPEM